MLIELTCLTDRLGNQISMVIGYFDTRARERRSRWRERYEAMMNDEANGEPRIGLADEIAMIDKIAQKEQL